MEFRILGSLEAFDGGRRLELGGSKQRQLFAILLLHANEVVSADMLIEELWGAKPPATAAKGLHVHLSRLRKALARDDLLVTRSGGYTLVAPPEEIDASRFELLAARGRERLAAGDIEGASADLRESLRMWRGPPLGDFAYEAFAQREIARLEELRLVAVEDRTEADLAGGRDAELVGELEGLVAANPLRERLRAQLMIALYRAGRQAEALAQYQEARRVLVEGLGIEPTAALKTLERQILAQDPALDAPPRVGLLAEELGLEPDTTRNALERQILAEDPPVELPTRKTAAPPRQELKRVTVLVAELSGPSDPEELERLLEPALARARELIAGFGATVQPLFSNALIGIFGAPLTHEDDTERAMRAGAALVHAPFEEGHLTVRVGIERGDALVTIEGDRIEVTGEVVAAAARLQATAPANGVAIGEAVERSRVATEGRERPFVGRRRTLPPLNGARSRFGIDLEPAGTTPFLGREAELELLTQAYTRTLRESACHLITLIGEPGIGKSRLVAEFRQWVDDQSELVFWRQGRCLPYGDGIALWALGEIVKAHAGILESDAPATARAKLAAAVEPLVFSASDQPWIIGELARLVGAGERGGARDESFAAWRAFLEAVAAQQPLVVVAEDLHWADAALLDFLEHLAEWSAGVPLLVVCTARPELHDVRPAWSGGKRNATTMSLSPLSSKDTARLLAALLERTVPAETQHELLERAGGNPLYAEQFVRMLRERPAGSETAVPESVHALIAARLDTLVPERKALLQDAAVIGKVFWAGAVSAVGGGDDRVVGAGLHELVRRELVRSSRLSSVEGEKEFAFGHALVRDVAYAQIPRAARASKHEAAARWIESFAGDRVDDHAELLAHHYREALGLARAVRVETQALEDGARRFLWLAARRASAIDVARSDAYFEEALALAPAEHPDRGHILIEWAEHTERDSVPLLEEALAELRAAQDDVGAGKAMTLLSRALWRRGVAARADSLLDEALLLLERHEPGPELANAYTVCAGRGALGANPEAALEWTKKGIALADRLGLESLVQTMRQYQGFARCDLGDLGGLEDLREALRASIELGLTDAANIAFSNYGTQLWLAHGADEALPVYRECFALNDRRGRVSPWLRAESTWSLFDAGRWDELLDVAQAGEELAAEHGSGLAAGQPLIMVRASKARVLFYRGRQAEAEAIARELVGPAREIGDAQIVCPVFSLAALVEPDADAALRLLEELLAVDAPENPLHPDSARVCVRHGAVDLAERMIRTDDRAAPRARHVSATIRAILAEARNEREEAARLYEDAVRRWTEYPYVLERALCLLGLSRANGDAKSAEEARALLRSLGAEAFATRAA